MFDELAHHVRAAAARPDAFAAVHDLYAKLQQAVEQRKPICTISGRCCRFEEYDHRLYVTTLELAAFTANLSATPHANPGGCPFQIGKLCGVHSIRPMGCRIFFCDPTAGQWQQQLYEQLHADLKQLHERLAIPYFYVEWRAALQALRLDAQSQNL
jgi:Fe-S-cluster containining protein